MYVCVYIYIFVLEFKKKKYYSELKKYLHGHNKHARKTMKRSTNFPPLQDQLVHFVKTNYF